MSREVQVSLGAGRYATAVRVGPHALTADEPGELGGGDTGPSPLDLLLSALATCKAITVRMYADRKGWPLERVEALARAASMAGHAVATIAVELRFQGDLTPEQRERLLDVAEKCPVQKAITAGVQVESRQVESRQVE